MSALVPFGQGAANKLPVRLLGVPCLQESHRHYKNWARLPPGAGSSFFVGYFGFCWFFFPSSLTQDASNPSKGTMGEPLLMLGVKYPQDGFKTGLCAVPRGGASPCLVSSSAGAKSWARCQVCDPCQRGRDLESKVELLLCERWPEIPSKTTERSLFLPMPTGLPSPRACGRPQGCSAREQEG